MLRHVGILWGWLAGFLDAGKALLAIWLAGRLYAGEQAQIVTGLSVILGHNYPVWLRFRGGKGVAPMIGLLFWWAPLGTLAGFVTSLLVFRWIGRVNIAVPVGALLILIITQFHGGNWVIERVLLGFGLLILVAYLPRFSRWLHQRDFRPFFR